MKVLPPVGHPNGGRLGNRKERTGCLTCKKRKIKCDEYKPYCYRCTSSGRECAGYTDPFGTNMSTTSPLSEEILTTRLAVNHQEHRAFDYFANSRARTMAGPFDLELWSRLVPQLSQTIPAVRHAAMTIGALLLRIDKLCLREQRPSSLALNEAYAVFAAKQYQKSIQATIHALDDKGGSPLIASTTCILYFCIEALQGNEHQALHLFDSARKAKLATTQCISNETLLFNAESTFSRLGVQWSMFDNTAVHDVADAPVFSQPITSISQAQSELISLVTHAFDVWKVNFQEKWSDSWNSSSEQVGHKLQSRQRSINDGFDDWHARFEAYKTQLNVNIELPQNSMASSTLILWHNAMSIWLAGSSARSEMIYDNFESRFETINVEASRMLNNIEQQGERVSFTFELGVIPPLYLSVLLCRQPLLRRQSLDYLRRAPAQEGLWRRAIIVRACERLIELEEGSDGFIADIPDDLARRTVPEAMRCKTVKVELRSTSKDGTWGNHVEYYSKPYGVNGDWRIHQEFFAEL